MVKPLHVGLVDDRLAPGDVRAAARCPSRSSRSTTTPLGMPGALSCSSRARSCVLVAQRVAEHRLLPVHLAAERLGVGVDQQLVRVAAVALLRLVGAVHAQAVERARLQARARSRARRTPSPRADRTGRSPSRGSADRRGRPPPGWRPARRPRSSPRCRRTSPPGDKASPATLRSHHPAIPLRVACPHKVAASPEVFKVC